MRSIIVLFILLFIGNVTFAQTITSSDTTRKKNQKGSVNYQNLNKKEQEKQEIKITPGSSGVKRSIGYKFSALPGDVDPGNGVFRYNNGTISKVVFIYVDDYDLAGEDQTKWYSTWDDTTGATARGSVSIVEYEGKNVNVFNVTGVLVRGTGYWKIPVEYISGTLPANGDTYYYVFNRIAHKKPQPVQEPQVAEAPKPVQKPQETQPAQKPQVAETPKPIQKPQETQPAQKPRVAQTIPTKDTVQAAVERRTMLPAKTTQTVPARDTAVAAVERRTMQPAKTTQTVPARDTAQAAVERRTTQASQTTQRIPSNQQVPATQPNMVSPVTKPVVVDNIFATTSVRRRKCYRGIIEAGYAWGVGDYGINNFRFNFINGIMIGRFSSIGLGIGFREYFEGNENYTDRSLFSPGTQFPVFLDLRTSFSTKKITPYLALGIGNSAGYVSAVSDTAKTRQEGLFFNTSAGIWFNVTERFAVFAGIAYEIQKLEYMLLSDNSHYKKNTSSISLNIGIAF